MKLFKRVAAVSLACCMVAGLAACGNSGTSTSSGGSGDSAKSGDIVKLVVWGNGSADTEDCNEVAEAISKITREKIGLPPFRLKSFRKSRSRSSISTERDCR